MSFVVRYGEQFLHHNYVVALLNDVFGIQSRGGCSCAGPYGHRLLGIDLERSSEFVSEIHRGCEGIKPGWVRLSFNYFIDEDTFAYIVDAVNLIATDGFRLLPEYRFEPASGLWQHAQKQPEPPMSLTDISYASGSMQFENRRSSGERDFAHFSAEARKLFDKGCDATPCGLPDTTADFEHLRWFPYPDEVASQ